MCVFPASASCYVLYKLTFSLISSVCLVCSEGPVVHTEHSSGCLHTNHMLFTCMHTSYVSRVWFSYSHSTNIISANITWLNTRFVQKICLKGQEKIDPDEAALLLNQCLQLQDKWLERNERKKEFCSLVCAWRHHRLSSTPNMCLLRFTGWQGSLSLSCH